MQQFLIAATKTQKQKGQPHTERDAERHNHTERGVHGNEKKLELHALAIDQQQQHQQNCRDGEYVEAQWHAPGYIWLVLALPHIGQYWVSSSSSSSSSR